MKLLKSGRPQRGWSQLLLSGQIRNRLTLEGVSRGRKKPAPTSKELGRKFLESKRGDRERGRS